MKPYRLSLYPQAYHRLIDTVGASGRSVRLTAPSRAEAFKLRSRFYGFRQALRAEGLKDQAALADVVEVRIGPKDTEDPTGPWFVEYRSRDQNAESQLLLSALEAVENER